MSKVLRFHLLPPLLAALTAIGSLLAIPGLVVWQHWLPAALWHLAFAVGALPMIFAAMGYFVPVLTRTPEAPRALAVVPLIALAAGFGIVGWFAHGVVPLRHASPWLALAATLMLGGWIARRRRACLGRPHPCLNWYAAALLCLGLGLLAVGLSAIVPELAQPLRAFHLHVNTLGFMGLTALGTLQVLLPTVFSQPDPAASVRLSRDLPWSLTGTLLVAIGAAIGPAFGSPWLWLMAAAGALCYAWPLWRLASASLKTYGRRLWSPGQAAPLLLAAIAGLVLLLLHGLAHGAGLARARDALPLFLVGFLLPLVSGAVAQLLPVWLRHGAHAEWHREERRRLAAFARSRACLLLAGGMLAAAGRGTGYAFGMLGALWLIAGMALAAIREFSSRP